MITHIIREHAGRAGYSRTWCGRVGKQSMYDNYVFLNRRTMFRAIEAHEIAGNRVCRLCERNIENGP